MGRAAERHLRQRGVLVFGGVSPKPQVKAQMTYFLPDKAGSHDFKFGFEDIYDSYHFGINGQSGPYRLSYATPASPLQARRTQRYARQAPARARPP